MNITFRQSSGYLAVKSIIEFLIVTIFISLCYDMSGNVSEWCLDEIHPYNIKYSYERGQRLQCGGNFGSTPEQCLILINDKDNSVYWSPWSAYGADGFRLALVPVGEGESCW